MAVSFSLIKSKYLAINYYLRSKLIAIVLLNYGHNILFVDNPLLLFAPFYFDKALKFWARFMPDIFMNKN